MFVCLQCSIALTRAKQSYFCGICDATYPIVRDIPRFSNDSYVSNFGFEWNIHRKTQIDSEERRESQKHFENRFRGHLNSFKNAKVLDVGVGVGRYALIAARLGGKVVGVDLSSSVEIARDNLAAYDAEVVQADLFKLPFENESFDIIYSFGVLHHTPDPKLAFSRLLPLLKPGGSLCITVYEHGSMYHTSRYARKITTKLPNRILYFLCAVYVLLMYIPYKFFGLRYGFLGRLIPISLSNNLFEVILDTFDCYSPKYQFTYREGEIYSWFKEEGLTDIEFKSEPVTLIGKK